MQKFLLLFFVFLSSVAIAQSRVNDITSPFKLWLLNNEAKAFSALSSDEMLTNKVSLPFAFLLPSKGPAAKAEEKLWETHRKIYVLLDETQNTYAIARQFGNGRFAVVLKQARPEIWSLLPVMMFRPELIPALAPYFRKAFHNTLLKTLQLAPERDIDLSARMSRATKKLSDEEFRLLSDYFSTFAALFPSDGSIKVLRGFIETGSKKPFGMGIRELLKPSTGSPATTATATVATTATTELDDPLAELEKLAQFDSGEITTLSEPADKPEAGEGENSTPTQPAVLEPPPPGTDDLFKIWE